jgi:hypothetical protein
MLGTVGMVVVWGLLGAGSPGPRIPGEGFVVLTGGDRVPTASELIVETLKMDQAIRTLERQTQQFETDQRCRRTPEQCPPLIENKARPQRERDSGEGVIIIEGAPPESAPSGSSSPPPP